MQTKDGTVVHNIGFEGFGAGANIVAVDTKDGDVVRIRPLHYDEDYTKEDLNYWTLEGRDGKTF